MIEKCFGFLQRKRLVNQGTIHWKKQQTFHELIKRRQLELLNPRRNEQSP